MSGPDPRIHLLSKLLPNNSTSLSRVFRADNIFEVAQSTTLYFTQRLINRISVVVEATIF